MQPPENTSRRQVIAGLLGSAIASSLNLAALRAEAAAAPSLKALAADKGILFGSSVGAGKAGSLTGSFADPAYVGIIKAECAVIVPENELKIYVIGAERGQYAFERGDLLASFAKQNGLKLRGKRRSSRSRERFGRRPSPGSLDSTACASHTKLRVNTECAAGLQRLHVMGRGP